MYIQGGVLQGQNPVEADRSCWGFGVCLAVPLIFNLQFWEVFSLSATLKATATVDRKSGHG